MKFILVPCHGILSRYSAESFIFFILSIEFSKKTFQLVQRERAAGHNISCIFKNSILGFEQ